MTWDDASPVRRVPIGETGHVVHGPYEMRPPGIYRVNFAVALDGSNDQPDRVCAHVDVCHDNGRRILASRSITTGELETKSRIFSLLIDLPSIFSRLEYRVFSTGEAAMLVGATPQVVRVSGVLDLLPQETLADMDAEGLAADTRRILRRLEPRQLDAYGFVRMGNAHDGGYVCVDDWERIDTAFSFGINDDISWDRAVADRGLRIFQFDHTVADPAPDDERMVFQPKMIAADAGPGRQDLPSLVRAHDKGLARPNIILKSDIEGGEWAMLESCSLAELSRIAWIVCELHYFQGLAEPEYRASLDAGLEKLSEVFALVHVHSNVWGGYSSLSNVIFPNVIEATFVNRAVYGTSPGTTLYPTPLDRSCDERTPDFFLGSFRF